MACHQATARTHTHTHRARTTLCCSFLEEPPSAGPRLSWCQAATGTLCSHRSSARDSLVTAKNVMAPGTAGREELNPEV